MVHLPVKGRHPRPSGETHPNAKISDAQVRELYALKGTMLQREAAALYGIDQTCVSLIWNRKGRYKNL